MSTKIKLHGEWVDVATNELVLGASTVRKGTGRLVKRSGSNFLDCIVTFDTPMPDADYCVDINFTYIYGISAYCQVRSKSVNGFSLNGYVANDADAAHYGTDPDAWNFHYTAFKLITVADAVGVVDKIEDNNMNGVTSNAVYDATKTIVHDLSEVTWNTTYVDLGTWVSGGLLEKGGIVQFSKIFTVKAGVPAGTVICSGLPRPAMLTEIPASWDDYSAKGGFFLNNAGEISVWSDVTVDTNCRINLVYVKA